MLPLPHSGERYRVLGIDPGSSTLGLTLLEVTLGETPLDVTYSETLTMTGREYPLAEAHHHVRLARHMELEDAFLRRLHDLQPHVIASESPFMGRFAAAFKALSECMIIVQRCAYHVNPQLGFHYYAPSQVKSAVGVNLSGRKGRTKDDNRQAVHGHPDLRWHIDPSTQDEHMVDATAVAYTHVRGLTS